jgi:hypothetical protein
MRYSISAVNEGAPPQGNRAGNGDGSKSSNRDTEGTRHRLRFISSPTLRRSAASDDKGFFTASNWPDRLGVTAPWRIGARDRSRLRGSRLTNRRDGIAALRCAPRRGCFLSRFRRNLAAGAATRSAPPMKITTRRSLRRVVLNVIDGCIPSDMAVGSREQVEEERRLLYVAMTRARQHLHLVQPMRLFRSHRHRHGDGHILAMRSRFIPEWHPRPLRAPSHGEAGHRVASATGSPVRVDVAARMREMWD